MKKYATISVLKEVKELLKKEKRDRNWSELLLELYKETKTSRAKMAFEELRLSLNEKDLEEILKSSKEFRKGFKLK